MASKRISLTLKERLILAKALGALRQKSDLDKSYAADLGRTEIERLSMKVSGGIATR